MMTDPWLLALLGGALIGLAATALLLLNGRVMGVSGILSGILWPQRGEWGWRLALVLGLLVGGAVAGMILDQAFVSNTGRPMLVILLAGILVGYGTRLGSGCTSGHGVCGISRLSLRSILATLTFMAAGIVTVRLFAMLFGGGL